ncbi:MAG: hypothetical protein CSA65_04035 [Proteobacteria bacterium]|nr:MAG: hypothetical protein CSA65_04035 [Pseudomonadota bacterium]
MSKQPGQKPFEAVVVDDTSIDRLLLTTILTKSGHRVRDFPDEKKVIEAAREAPPEIFLLDIGLPTITGYELCRRIKRCPDLSDIPVVFVSGRHGPDDELQAFVVGGADYVQKPFRQREVLARVGTHVEALRLRREQRRQREELEQALERRQRLERRNEQLLSFITHELLQPLVAISSDHDAGGAAKRVLASARRANQLTATMLELLRSEQGRVPLQRSPVKLGPLFELMKAKAGAQGQTLDVQLKAAVRATPLALDGALLERAIDILLSCLQRGDEGTPLRAEVALEAERLRITLAATAPRRSRGPVESCALGLSFCEMIAEAHGGRVELLSNRTIPQAILELPARLCVNCQYMSACMPERPEVCPLMEGARRLR